MRKSVRFDERGLVPAVVQDARDGRVLLLAYMSAESLAATRATGEVHFYSRRRQALWRKGETSGHVLRLVDIALDCDGDALLVRVVPAGPACHTGARSCFDEAAADEEAADPAALGRVLGELAATIRDRRRGGAEGSYTARLLRAGRERIAQKVGEEALEVALAAVGAAGREALVRESADLLYHLLVLWEQTGVSFEEIAGELVARRGRGPGGRRGEDGDG